MKQRNAKPKFTIKFRLSFLSYGSRTRAIRYVSENFTLIPGQYKQWDFDIV